MWWVSSWWSWWYTQSFRTPGRWKHCHLQHLSSKLINVHPAEVGRTESLVNVSYRLDLKGSDSMSTHHQLYTTPNCEEAKKFSLVLCSEERENREESLCKL